MAAIKDKLLDIDKGYLYGDVFSEWVYLAYDKDIE